MGRAFRRAILIFCWVVGLLCCYLLTANHQQHQQHQHDQQHQSAQPTANTKKQQEKKKGNRTTTKTTENRQIDPKLVQEGSRMELKWSQNGKKGVHLYKMVSRWLPGPISSEGLVDFCPFLGPLWIPKIDPK